MRAAIAVFRLATSASILRLRRRRKVLGDVFLPDGFPETVVDEAHATLPPRTLRPACPTAPCRRTRTGCRRTASRGTVTRRRRSGTLSHAFSVSSGVSVDDLRDLLHRRLLGDHDALNGTRGRCVEEGAPVDRRRVASAAPRPSSGCRPCRCRVDRLLPSSPPRLLVSKASTAWAFASGCRIVDQRERAHDVGLVGVLLLLEAIGQVVVAVRHPEPALTEVERRHRLLRVGVHSGARTASCRSLWRSCPSSATKSGFELTAWIAARSDASGLASSASTPASSMKLL